MKKLATLIVCAGLVAAQASADSFEAGVKPLFETTCFACHGEGTATPLNIQKLSYYLSDADVYSTWQRIYERLERGEMPPPFATTDAIKPLIKEALSALKPALVDANIAARDGQRSSLRRLTRLEYAYTLQDLLHLDEEVALGLMQSLPAEADTGGFDTIAVNQGISALHVRSYLSAADIALDAAIQLGPRPETKRFEIDYAKSQYMAMISVAEIQGGRGTKMLDDAVVMFEDVGSTFTMHSASEGYVVPEAGLYRVTLDAYPYQADTPVVLTLYRGTMQGITASLDDLIGSFDLIGPQGRVVDVTTYLEPGMLVAPSVAEIDNPMPGSAFALENDVFNHPGEGIAVRSMVIEGPLRDVWPPISTREILSGIDFDPSGQLQLSKPAADNVYEIVDRFAQRAFRRPLTDGEAKLYADLAQPLLEDGRPFLEALWVPLRAILTAPSFLFQDGPAGSLNDYQLASRLSYFLWRSLPDDALLAAAESGRLSESAELARQVERMLHDPKSKRFVNDFAGQAYRLYEMKATAPDLKLYPEYDDRLGQAAELETELFLAELIEQNLGIANLIDADFTFLNRRLAEHYGVPGIEGQQMRKVTLPADSLRGGLLTQASIHKITANGTSTSPIPRGNFVLDNFLGRPAPQPPANVGGVEPDTRGTTTIREQLEAHRSNPICASCHRNIDPPGFALESFDPIGGLRSNYSFLGEPVNEYYASIEYNGLPVDASGVTTDGESFEGFADYQRILLERELDAVAYNFVSQLIAFGTGANIEFADRDEVDKIIAASKEENYSMSTMIHMVVDSELFRSR